MKEQKHPSLFPPFEPLSTVFCTTDVGIAGAIEPTSGPIAPYMNKHRRRGARKKEEQDGSYSKFPATLFTREEPKILPALHEQLAAPNATTGLLQLYIKKGEYVYARPWDIVLMESCDHLVKVYIAYGEKVKRAVRGGTLKDFLLQLPQHQFLRLSRFCAVNLDRLSGGNYIEQAFEFDFRVSIKLKHTLPFTIFKTIGA